MEKTTPFQLTGATTFVVPLVDPFSKAVVTAEELYRAACAQEGRQITEWIGDLIFDNLDYPEGHLQQEVGARLCAQINAWEQGVHAQLRAAGYGEG